MAQSSEEFEPVTISELTGARGPVRVTLRGAPALRSTRTGALKPVEVIRVEDGEDGWDVISPVLFLHTRTMFACGSYVMKLKEYLPRLIFQCQGCQRKLAEGPGEPHRFEFEAVSLDLPPVRVQLDAPAVACPGCGRYSVLWSDEMSAHIEGAIADAVAALPTQCGL